MPTINESVVYEKSQTLSLQAMAGHEIVVQAWEVAINVHHRGDDDQQRLSLIPRHH
jgi:hypothetical protein